MTYLLIIFSNRERKILKNKITLKKKKNNKVKEKIFFKVECTYRKESRIDI